MSAEGAESVMLPVSAETHTRRWFADGAARLAIDVDYPVDARIDALQDAALLGRLDVLLSDIERRCQREFEWRPSGVDDTSLTVSVRQDATLLGLALSSTDQERLLTAVNENDSCSLQLMPHRESRYLELQTFALDADDVKRLRPGAMLLIPASYHAAWTAQLQIELTASARASECVNIDVASGLVTVRDDAVSDRQASALTAAALTDREARAAHCRVFLDAPVDLRRDVPEEERAPLAQLHEGDSVSVQVVTDRAADSGQTYAGRLLQVGRGWAVRLNTP